MRPLQFRKWLTSKLNLPSKYLSQAAAALVAFSLASTAVAFPSTIRKNYPSCASCHVSPSGGGVLTGYGRGSGDEFLPSWAREGEGASLYGATAANPTLALGGDVRWVKVERRDVRSYTKSEFLMQADAEPALTIGKLTLAGQGGKYASGTRQEFQSRRHYALIRNGNFTVRAGRFTPNYGLNLANHTALIRDLLGFGQGTETYNLETGYQGEYGEVFLTGIVSKANLPGATVRLGGFLRGRFVAGLNCFYQQKPGGEYRTIFGTYGALGLSPTVYSLFEFDMETEVDKNAYISRQRGYGYLTVGVDVAPGVQVSVTAQGLLEIGQEEQRVTSGIAWIPRPHFEISLDYGTAKRGNQSSLISILMLHYWL